MSQPVEFPEPVEIPLDAEIRELAHSYWQAEGCPAHREVEHWLRAEAELTALKQRLNGDPVKS